MTHNRWKWAKAKHTKISNALGSTTNAQQAHLQVLLSVEHNRLGLDFSVFDITLVATENYRDVLTDSNKISVPVRYVLVRDACSYIKHDDSTLTWKPTTAMKRNEQLLIFKCSLYY